MPSKERKAMDAVIGKDDSIQGTMGEIMQQVHESLLPILKQMTIGALAPRKPRPLKGCG
jgi:hypothetical protein